MKPSLASVVVVVGLVGCGAADTSRTRDVRPYHPTCAESCAGHCEDDAEACRTRCARECAPAATPAARVLAFVEAVQASEARLDPVLSDGVAWRVYLAGLGASALPGVSPAEQAGQLRLIVEELERAGTEAHTRSYADRWRAELGAGRCSIAEGHLEADPFTLSPALTEEVRARLGPELAPAASGHTTFDVTCPGRGFQAVVLADGTLVPLL